METAINEIGNQHHFLTVVARAGNDKRGRARWECRCDCGENRIVTGCLLRSGTTKSCGRCSPKRPSRRPKHDLIGQTFTYLRVVGLAGQDSRTNALWNCQCLLCGRRVTVAAPLLLNRGTKSCGCLRSVKIRETNQKKPRLTVAERDMRSIMQTYRYHARKQDVPFEIEPDRWEVLITGACHYCEKPPAQRIRKDGMLYNGVDKMDRLKGYIEGNVVSCCKTCNLAKGKMTHDEFLSWVISVYQHLMTR